MSAKTVFISYRRDATGRPFARSLKEALSHHGYDVFLDVDCMDAGKWADQILTQVPARSHFLFLITPGSLDRCSDPNDWVRREFELAVASGRNIVPIQEESVDISKVSRDCPACVKPVFDYQIATIINASFEKHIEILIERYIPPHKAPTHSAPGSQRQPPAPGIANLTAQIDCTADISRILKYAPAELIGRETETKLLHGAWAGRAELPRLSQKFCFFGSRRGNDGTIFRRRRLSKLIR